MTALRTCCACTLQVEVRFKSTLFGGHDFVSGLCRTSKQNDNAAMPGMTIGEVAKRAGLAPSAIRYYEKSGLIAAPHRRSKQRRYDPDVLGRIALIQLARDAGFTIRETRTLIAGFAPNTQPSARWRTLAEKKLVEIDAQMARARKMQALLKEGFRCGCPALEDCERVLARSGVRGRCG